jgi:V/A-type H+-transporting ATPase subunit F
MGNLFLIGDEDTVVGFRLAGIKGHVPRDTAAARELFGEAVGDREVRIVLITERIAEAIRPELDEHTAKGKLPFAAEIPDSSGPLPTRRSPLDIVKEAIGVSI